MAHTVTQCMDTPGNIRRLPSGPCLALWMLISGLASGGTVLLGQTSTSGLPATPPTHLTTETSVGPIAATPVTGTRGRRAQVTFSAGMLQVRAENSSLNGILHDIARVTGMRVTGSVAEGRVFGDYGPAAPATVLATLLDGTGSNMLLRETADNAPAELILTPRTGGASPPFSTSDPNEDEPDATPVPNFGQPATIPTPNGTFPLQRSGRDNTDSFSSNRSGVNGVSGPQSLPPPSPSVNGSPNNTSPTAATFPTTDSVSTDSIPTPSTTPSVSGIVDSPNPLPATPNPSPAGSTAAPAATDNSGASTPRTPEQIYQELQRLRQAAQPSTTLPPM